MTLLRNIWSDLVDKRLWPAALALVIALVAIPVVIGGGGPSASIPVQAPTPASPTALGVSAAGAANAAVTLETASAGRRNHAGAVHNPFVQKFRPSVKTPGSAAATGAPATPVTTGGGAASPVGSAPTGGTGSTPVSPSTPGAGPTKPAPVKDVWRVNLRFGEAGNQHVHHNVPRLTPLPSSTDPFFVFLGVLSDGKTAVFLISSDATATGDGKCKPTPAQCDTIEMRAGDTEFFDVTQGTAGVVQYELDLLKVAHDKVRGAAARAARRTSAGGRDVIHELKAEGDRSLGRYIYSYRRGVLVRRHGLRVKAAAIAQNADVLVGAHQSSTFGTAWGG